MEKIFAAFVNQPLCSGLTLDEAEKLFKEMVADTREYLDEFYDFGDYL